MSDLTPDVAALVLAVREVIDRTDLHWRPSGERVTTEGIAEVMRHQALLALFDRLAPWKRLTDDQLRQIAGGGNETHR